MKRGVYFDRLLSGMRLGGDRGADVICGARAALYFSTILNGRILYRRRYYLKSVHRRTHTFIIDREHGRNMLAMACEDMIAQQPDRSCLEAQGICIEVLEDCRIIWARYVLH
jgi:hypothetical protein